MKYIIPLFLFAHTLFAQTQSGTASFYADKFEGTYTASGERYKHSKLTAAHKSLPFGTRVRVTNTANQKTAEVVINDRGPYTEGRILDVSKAAAEKLGFTLTGLAQVTLEVLDAGTGKTSARIFISDEAPAEDKEFYALEVKHLKPKGFGVQIGTFQELANLMRLTENLRNSYRKQIAVQVKTISGVKYYGLIIGRFSSQTAAYGLLEDLKGKFPDAFVFTYAGK
ncbi:MAG: septal ring lytic transglycosylase RlpA family lipoprotein [Candidatus Nephrothrix sp. EaCA]|nr:MAG: septal ring lytic transglycosylase RlpA family lipoprotein [Candidatus Nephrothrix sp. EaCA]